MIAGAAGHEIARWNADSARPIVLRRTYPVDIDASCGAKRCEGEIIIVRNGYEVGSHLELPAGPQELDVRANPDGPGQMRARETVVVAAAPVQHASVTLAPTGTGLSISGTVARDMFSMFGLVVEARCGVDEIRRARVHEDGTFELQDAPPPPCRIDVIAAIRGYSRAAMAHEFSLSYRAVTITKLPASQIDLEPKCRSPQGCRSLDGMHVIRGSGWPSRRTAPKCIEFDFGAPLECAKP